MIGNPVKRVLKIIGIIVLVVAALGAIMFGSIMYFTASEREVARGFLINATSGNFDAARAVMHPALLEDVADPGLERMFGDAQPYSDVSFANIQTSGGRTSLSGTAKTADGCASAIDFELIEDILVSFNISPLCRKP